MELTDKTICIFCASSPRTPEKYFNEAFRLGQTIARNEASIICGAGRAGLMKAITDGANSENGKVIGVIPRFMVDKGWNHPHLTETIITDDMHTRKETMNNRCDAIIALPGGVGTLEELLEVITWRQLGLSDKPIVILNMFGYFDNLLQMFDNAIDKHFMSGDNRTLWHIANTADDAIAYLKSYQPISAAPIEKY